MNYQIFKMNIEHLTGETKQNKIADILHVSPSKLSKWFTGELLPTFTDILNISKAYQCSIDWLIGNSFSSSQHISNYDICKILVELDSCLFINIGIEEVIENVSFWDNEKNIYINKKYKNTIPKIYMPKTMSINDIENKVYNYQNWAEELESHYPVYFTYNGTILKDNCIINDFLIKYIQIREVYYKNLISENVFKDIVNNYLMQLNKEPIIYSPFNERYSGLDTEEVPWDDDKISTDEIDKNKIIMKDIYNIKNIIKGFAERFKIEFLNQDECLGNTE